MKEKIQPFKKGIISLTAGILTVLALPPYELWPFMFIGFSVFFLMFSQTESRKQAFFIGWCFGFGYFAASLWWIANALLVEGNPFSWVWPFAIAGLPALLAVFPALATYAAAAASKNKKSLHSFCCFVVFLTISEYLRGHIFTGFPWNLYGYGWNASLAMLQSVSIGGIYFLTFLTIFWASLIGFLVTGQSSPKYKILLLAVGIATLAGNYMFGHSRLKNTPTTFNTKAAVHIVQPNTKQEDKWNSAKAGENINRLISLSAPDQSKPQRYNKTTFIIWPETAITERLLAHETVRTKLKETLSLYKNDVYLLTGILRKEGNQYFNSLVVLDKNLNLIEKYDKSHLVPFGEYVPLANILPLQPFVQLSGFTKGRGPKSIAIKDAPRFSPLICYEIIFPGKVRKREFIPETEWLVNVTNDAWYGISPGPYQHFAQARVRAIEEGIPVIRAANTGFSGMISPTGTIIHQSTLFKQGSYSTDIPHILEKRTIFSKNNNYFLFIILAFATICILLCFIKQRKA